MPCKVTHCMLTQPRTQVPPHAEKRGYWSTQLRTEAPLPTIRHGEEPRYEAMLINTRLVSCSTGMQLFSATHSSYSQLFTRQLIDCQCQKQIGSPVYHSQCHTHSLGRVCHCINTTRWCSFMNNGVRVLYRENGIIIDLLFIECLVSYLLLALAVPLWVCSFLAGHIHFQYQLQWIEDPVCV